MAKLSDDQSGIGRKIVIIFLVVFIAAAVITWSLTKKSTNDSTDTTAVNSSSTSTSVSSPCLNAYHDSLLCAFAQHVNIFSYSYTATGTAISANGTTAGFTVKNDGKGNREVIYVANNEQLSSIALDGAKYVQEGVGTTWLAYSNGSSEATSVPDPSSGFNLSFTNAASSQYSYTNEGTISCGSLVCNEYKVTVIASPAIDQYVYFDTSNHLLRKWAYNNPITGTSVIMTVDYQSVTISKPSPVQQVST